MKEVPRREATRESSHRRRIHQTFLPFRLRSKEQVPMKAGLRKLDVV